ncbi:hypothetical protein KRE49_11740 [Elizabethkingia meningoseptica]|uniref:hypothetical protein n=1 Tax=Elizabethkingia meningoseptica TaxID=238 RepID=UPI0023AF2C2A|nr:hypothetical protein [Elizabethkingia meningoseptica]MDE5516411.1 hypothetical protein [Elizabethkingia meningoseptica]MDN4033731.1 hypothetical protein [Elizabethkingia meningoseptica]
MEGNYRIVQISDTVFIIQKENIITSICRKWFKTILVKKSKWIDCDEKGYFVHSLMGNKRMLYVGINDARKALERIKKYPLVVE